MSPWNPWSEAAAAKQAHSEEAESLRSEVAAAKQEAEVAAAKARAEQAAAL